jgi:type IV pilus assembly protein PilB
VVPSVDLRAHRPAHSATKLLTKELCERHMIVPVRVAQRVLVVAMPDPDTAAAAAAVAEVAVLTGMKVEIVRASVEEIEVAIGVCYGGAS